VLNYIVIDIQEDHTHAPDAVIFNDGLLVTFILYTTWTKTICFHLSK